jgi:predicted regulator of Ras-like GTPase activity (Roadblock/LC7/MglB family)
VPESALTPHAAVERLGETSTGVRAAILLDDGGGLVARTGVGGRPGERLGRRAADLFGAADAAAARGGLAGATRVEVSRPQGAVFGVRAADPEGRGLTLVAIAAGGALSSLVLYDMRMALLAMGARP